jgi:hypothetical protein
MEYQDQKRLVRLNFRCLVSSVSRCPASSAEIWGSRFTEIYLESVGLSESYIAFESLQEILSDID